MLILSKMLDQLGQWFRRQVVGRLLMCEYGFYVVLVFHGASSIGGGGVFVEVM